MVIALAIGSPAAFGGATGHEFVFENRDDTRFGPLRMHVEISRCILTDGTNGSSLAAFGTRENPVILDRGAAVAHYVEAAPPDVPGCDGPGRRWFRLALAEEIGPDAMDPDGATPREAAVTFFVDDRVTWKVLNRAGGGLVLTGIGPRDPGGFAQRFPISWYDLTALAASFVPDAHGVIEVPLHCDDPLGYDCAGLLELLAPGVDDDGAVARERRRLALGSYRLANGDQGVARLRLTRTARERLDGGGGPAGLADPGNSFRVADDASAPATVAGATLAAQPAGTSSNATLADASMPDATYGLNVENRSSQSGSVCLYQSGYATNFPAAPVVWLSRFLFPGTAASFTWDPTWAFVWAETGPLIPGLTIVPAQMVPAGEFADQIMLGAQNGILEFDDPTAAGPPGTFSIVQSDAIPPGQGVVGIAMSGATTVVTGAIAGAIATFAPDPQYWLFFGNCMPGQVIDPVALQSATRVVFPPGVFSTTAVLEPDLTWTFTND